MRFSTASLTLALLPSALTWVILPQKLNRREFFELTERDDSASDGGWIVPANVTVEGSEPGDDWIPMAEYLKSQGITPLETLDDPSNLEEHMDPLPLPPVKRELFSRREPDTRVNIGKKLTDYGCDASIRKPIEEALNALCRNGFCDRSQKYTRQVNWLDNGWGSGISRRTLEVSIEGDYRGPRTKGNVIEAAKRAINPDTTSSADRQQKVDSPTCQRWGICKIEKCKMSKFGEYISITKLVDFNTFVQIKISVKLHQTNNHCIARGVLNAVGGSISGIAGGFFGVAEAFMPDC